MSDTPNVLLGKVDVVIPCFNDGAFLFEAIESLGPDRVAGQGVIIVNDGSTDQRTLDVLEALRARGFRVIDTANSGLSAARNTGWRASTATYVLFLDADNRLVPGFLERADRWLRVPLAPYSIRENPVRLATVHGVSRKEVDREFA